MTTITRAFLKLVKENYKEQTTLARKVLSIVILTLVLFILIVWFFVHDIYLALTLGSVIYLVLASCVVLFVFSNRPKCDQSLELSSEAAQKLQASMKNLGLPLDQCGSLIKNELQDALAQKQQSRKCFSEYARKTFNAIVLVPCAFLLSLLFQAMFDKSVLLQLEDVSSPISFIVEIFLFLMLIMLLSLTIYPLIVNFAKFINGENQLQTCLELLKEIDVYNTVGDTEWHMGGHSSECKLSDSSSKSDTSSKSIRNWCIVGLLLVALSCIGCVACSFIAVAKFEQAGINITVSILGIAVSIWVALNIYNVISNKEIQHVHAQAEIVKKSTKRISKEVARAQKKLDYLSSDLEDVQAALDNNIRMEIRNELTAIINIISQNAAYYSFTGHLLNSFQKLSESKDLEKLPRDIWGLIVRIENSFSAAAALNRANIHEERARLAQIGSNYCNELESALKHVPDSEFIKAYCYLRTGDFLFYQGYRIQTEKGIHFLDDAITFYKKAFAGMFSLCDNNAHIDYLIDTQDYGRPEEESLELVRALQMQAYLFNIIGECYNVRSQYTEIKISLSDSVVYKQEAVENFKHVYSIINFLRNKKQISPLYAKYLRNYGTALEKLSLSSDDPSPDELYKEALKIDSKDTLSYYTYSSYHLRRLQQGIPKMSDPKSFIHNNSALLLSVIDYLNVYIASNPTLSTAHFFKALAHLMLAFESDKQYHLNIARDEYSLAKTLPNGFRLSEETIALKEYFKRMSSNANLHSFLKKNFC